eukprot:16452372-Heterocapsa_arctica.AAC.1
MALPHTNFVLQGLGSEQLEALKVQLYFEDLLVRVRLHVVVCNACAELILLYVFVRFHASLAGLPPKPRTRARSMYCIGRSLLAHSSALPRLIWLLSAQATSQDLGQAQAILVHLQVLRRLFVPTRVGVQRVVFFQELIRRLKHDWLHSEVFQPSLLQVFILACEGDENVLRHVLRRRRQRRRQLPTIGLREGAHVSHEALDALIRRTPCPSIVVTIVTPNGRPGERQQHPRANAQRAQWRGHRPHPEVVCERKLGHTRPQS